MTTPVERLSASLADRHAIERDLGAGGMAAVYLARDHKHERMVALSTARAVIVKVITDRPRRITLARETVPGHVEAGGPIGGTCERATSALRS